MIGYHFSKYNPNGNAPSKFEELLNLFLQLLTYTNGDFNEAMKWMNELDKEYKLTNEEYGMGDFLEELKAKGYDEIAVCGLSLGGVMSLRLSMHRPVKAVIPMCAPAYIKSEEVMYAGVTEYAREFKKREGKSAEEIEQEMAGFEPMPTLKDLQALLKDTRDSLEDVYAPTLVIQARNDHMINTDSANIIHDGVSALQKDLIWYENSGHVITLDKEKETLHQDIHEFLDGLNWSH